MPFTISCPQCQKPLSVPDTAIGKSVRCPACQNTFAIVQPSVAPPSEVSAGPPPTTPAPAPSSGSESSKPAWEQDSPTTRRRKEEEAELERKRKLRREIEEEEEEAEERRRIEDEKNPFKLSGDERQGYSLPHRGGNILIMGIISILLCCIPIIGIALGVGALNMANTDLQRMRSGRMDPEGIGSTQAGRILGLIGMSLSVLMIFIAIALNAGGRR